MISWRTRKLHAQRYATERVTVAGGDVAVAGPAPPPSSPAADLDALSAQPINDGGAASAIYETHSAGPSPTPAPAPAAPVPESKLPPIGGFLHQYQVIRQIGRGGMGGVFLARDTRLGRLVALKFLTELGAERSSRLIAEARATARCQHENIVIIYEVGEHAQRPYMALEYLKGQTLRAHLRARTQPALALAPGTAPPLSAGRAVEIMVSVVRALAHAHAMNIIHRDLKPENIMLTEAGAVKVLDFGLAKPLAGAHRRAPTEQGPEAESLLETKSDEMVGTLPYMSPEQINGGLVDHRADIWACGIILFELVIGRHPLLPARRRDLERKIRDLDEPMPSVAAAGPELGTLAGVIDRCLIKRVEDRTHTTSELLAQLEALLPHQRPHSISSDENPYTGLAAFQESNADRFFGRDQDIAAATNRLRRQPLTAIIGPSGAGKSSLVRAGIIPALKRSGEAWDAYIVRPGRHPLAALAGVLEGIHTSRSGANSRPSAESIEDEEISLEQRSIVDQLRVEPGYFGVKLRERASKKLRQVLVFVDQFEELYTLGASDAERAEFIDCLQGAADDASSPLRVMLSLRSDFLDRLTEDHAFATAVSSGLIFLPPIGREGLRQALIRPVEAANHRFESEAMIERMLDELESAAGALPLLQFTASKLWELRDRGQRVLGQGSYEQLGGVAGALASHADAVLASMSPSNQALARQVLERLVTPEHTRAMVSMSELSAAAKRPSEVERVVHHLANARLLVVETADEDHGATVEIIHESLIEGWPTLERWLDEHREDVEFLARLRGAAKQWRTSGYSDGLLWRGEVARAAQRWHARYRGDLAPLEDQYLQATFTLATRDTRIKRALIAGSLTFLSLLVLISTVALLSIRSAEQEATRQASIVSQQLEKLQQNERILRSQESELRDALAKAQSARKDAEESRERLEQSLYEAEEAKAAAELALADAQSARDDARSAEAAAKRAALAEKRARDNLRKFVGLGPQPTKRGIRFNYRPREKVHAIYLAGNFNGWSPNDDYQLRDEDGDGVYSVIVQLRRGVHQYKFLVDGRWVKDPNAPETAPDGFGGMNGQIEIRP